MEPCSPSRLSPQASPTPSPAQEAHHRNTPKVAQHLRPTEYENGVPEVKVMPLIYHSQGEKQPANSMENQICARARQYQAGAQCM
jgi:hypothetical protein